MVDIALRITYAINGVERYDLMLGRKASVIKKCAD